MASAVLTAAPTSKGRPRNTTGSRLTAPASCASAAWNQPFHQCRQHAVPSRIASRHPCTASTSTRPPTHPTILRVYRDLKSAKGPSGNNCAISGRRGARPARREERAYRVYESDEQRSPAGCIGGQNGAVISGRALRMSRTIPSTADRATRARPDRSRIDLWRGTTPRSCGIGSTASRTVVASPLWIRDNTLQKP